GEAFIEFCQDIKTHGLEETIWIFEGQILDGRNRYRACLQTGVEPRFEIYTGDNPLAFVLSLNWTRRHMDASQRSMVAANIAALKRVTQVQAATMLGVSERSVRSGVVIRDHGIPPLRDAVERGILAVSAAAKIARLPESEQARYHEVFSGLRGLKEARRCLQSEDYQRRLYAARLFPALEANVEEGAPLFPPPKTLAQMEKLRRDIFLKNGGLDPLDSSQIEFEEFVLDLLTLFAGVDRERWISDFRENGGNRIADEMERNSRISKRRS